MPFRHSINRLVKGAMSLLSHILRLRLTVSGRVNSKEAALPLAVYAPAILLAMLTPWLCGGCKFRSCTTTPASAGLADASVQSDDEPAQSWRLQSLVLDIFDSFDWKLCARVASICDSYMASFQSDKSYTSQIYQKGFSC